MASASPLPVETKQRRCGGGERKELLTLRGHYGSVYGVTFSSDGKRLATAGYDDTAKIWTRRAERNC